MKNHGTTYNEMSMLAELIHLFSGDGNPISKRDTFLNIFAGINPENGHFFVGTQGIFSDSKNLNYTEADIDANFLGEKTKNQLKIALQYLPSLNIENVLQGQILFTKSDIRIEKFEERNYVTFKSNETIYMIPLGSDLANKIAKAEIGIEFHTQYFGDNLSSMSASFDGGISKLTRTEKVWIFDPHLCRDISAASNFTHSLNFDNNNIAEINEKLALFNKLGNSLPNSFVETIDSNKTPLKQWFREYNDVNAKDKIPDVNEYIGKMTKAFEKRMNKDILSAKKRDTKRHREKTKNQIMNFMRNNMIHFQSFCMLYNLTIDLRTITLNKMDIIEKTGMFVKTSDGYKIAPDKEFVVFNTGKNRIKMIDEIII